MNSDSSSSRSRTEKTEGSKNSLGVSCRMAVHAACNQLAYCPAKATAHMRGTKCECDWKLCIQADITACRQLRIWLFVGSEPLSFFPRLLSRP
jgi:hypothetical protein